MAKETTDRKDPELGYGSNETETPQNKAYLILSKKERKKGFIRPLRTQYKHITCGSITTMSEGIAETYARDPNFYGATYCVSCQMHRPVGEWRGGFILLN